MVLNATAGWSSEVARLAGVDLPITTHPLQAMVTEPLKPFLDKTISSANLHAYVYQTDRGEVVIGGGVDPYPSYSMRSALLPMEQLAGHTLEMFPCLSKVKVLRQWAGLCDMTPDYAPIMGPVDGLEGFIVSCGWGSWGFKAAPAAGKEYCQPDRDRRDARPDQALQIVAVPRGQAGQRTPLPRRRHPLISDVKNTENKGRERRKYRNPVGLCVLSDFSASSALKTLKALESYRDRRNHLC